MGFHTTYYFNIDSLQPIINRKQVFRYIQDEKVKIAVFNPSLRDYFKCKKCRVLPYNSGYRTVGMAMIWESLKMNYDPIYILGFDLSYKYPKKEKLQKINGPSDLNYDEETMNILRDATSKGAVNWMDVYLFTKDSIDKSHITNSYVEERIPFHYETTEEVIAVYKHNISRLSLEERNKIYNAGIGGNFNFVRRIDYESLF